MDILRKESAGSDLYCGRFRRGNAANFASNSRFIGVKVKKKGSRGHLIKYYPFCVLLATYLLSFCRYFQHLLSQIPFFSLFSIIREFEKIFAALPLLKRPQSRSLHAERKDSLSQDFRHFSEKYLSKLRGY